jgi:hypothetical protein
MINARTIELLTFAWKCKASITSPKLQDRAATYIINTSLCKNNFGYTQAV